MCHGTAGNAYYLLALFQANNVYEGWGGKGLGGWKGDKVGSIYGVSPTPSLPFTK